MALSYLPYGHDLLIRLVQMAGTCSRQAAFVGWAVAFFYQKIVMECIT